MNVQLLTKEPSVETRGLLAAGILTDFRNHAFNESETRLVEDIFRLLMCDTEVKLRAQLAAELAHCPHTPHDIILHLAGDQSTVALPVLQFSQVLSEEDLITLVRGTAEVARHCAIARRDTLSESLCCALVETSDTLVLHTLFTNKGAQLNETVLLPYWNDIPFTQPLLEALVKRGQLPMTVVEKLYYAVSNELKSQLTRLYPHHAQAIAKAAADAREWELLGITPDENTVGYDEDLAEDFIDDMYRSGRLTHSLLMRALCIGNLAVFEMGIARLADVPRINARILMTEASGKGLAAIYRAANMPEGFFQAVKVLLRLSLEESEFGRVKHNDFKKRVIDRIYMARYNRTVENMEYLLSILGDRQVASHAH